MAQGNPFNGMMRGRIGDTIFSRKNGQQQSRAHVSAPANPQTNAQMSQRVKFATCAAFYSQGEKAFYKFAFENKPKNTTDYNAFMAANVGRVPANTYRANRNGLPTPGYFIMSDGSLPSVLVAFNEEIPDYVGPAIVLDADFSMTADTTTGEVCQAIMDKYGLRKGDILTAVAIRGQGDVAQTIEEAEYYDSLSEDLKVSWPVWQIKQIMLDPGITTPVARSNFFEEELIKKGYVRLSLDVQSTVSGLAAVTVVVSRNTPNGLKVSRSVLKLNQAGVACEEMAQDEAWWQYCVDSYKNSSLLDNKYTAILQGTEL